MNINLDESKEEEKMISKHFNQSRNSFKLIGEIFASMWREHPREIDQLPINKKKEQKEEQKPRILSALGE